MRKMLAMLVTVTAVGAVTAPAPAGAGEVGPGLTFGAAAGGLTIGAVEAPAYGYDGYVYGPLPYARYYIPGDDYHSRVYHHSRAYHGSRAHRVLHIRHVVRVHHVTRATYAFDPYAGGGPFYHHHYCCRYW
jgi:hypothetical protein